MAFQRVRLIFTNTLVILLNSTTTCWLSVQVFKPRPLFFFWGSGIQAVRRDARHWGLIWDRDFSEAEGLSSSHILAGVSGPGLLTPWRPCGAWYLFPCCCSYICIHTRKWASKLVIESNARLSIKSQETAWFSELQRISFSGSANSCSQPLWCHCTWQLSVGSIICGGHIGGRTMAGRGSELPFGPQLWRTL